MKKKKNLPLTTSHPLVQTQNPRHKSASGLRSIHYVGMALGVLAFVYPSMLQPTTLGHDWRYYLLVVFVPTLLGFVYLFSVYGRGALADVRRVGSRAGRAYMLVFYFGVGVVLSYISAGLLATIVFHSANSMVASTQPATWTACPIEHVGTSRNNYSLSFQFDQRSEQITLEREVAIRLRDEGAQGFQLMLSVRPAWLGTHVVEQWNLQPKQ